MNLQVILNLQMNLQVILKITHERIIQTQILLVSSTQVFSCKFNLITFKFIHEFIQQLSSFKKLTQASFVLPVSWPTAPAHLSLTRPAPFSRICPLTSSTR